jgi:hypothetical protein
MRNAIVVAHAAAAAFLFFAVGHLIIAGEGGGRD